MFSHQYAGHLKKNKSRARLRRLKEPGVLEKSFAKKVKVMLGEA
jgi:ribosomal protein L35